MKFLLPSLLLLWTCLLQAAEISPFVSSDSESFILFQGEIIDGDLQSLKSVYKSATHKERTTLILHSMGGSVSEAIKIGNFLEENKISVIVWSGAPFGRMSCYSSCVLVLAGGYQKTTPGKIGIHRPYITDTEFKAKDIKSSLQKMKTAISQYLDGKGVSPQLAEDMFSTPPDEIKVLTSEEISRYRLDKTDYNKQEAEDLEMAKNLGWSRAELMRRRARWNKECIQANSKEMQECIKQIILE